ncbi:hypothetical protein TNCV_2310341 [Trichonephila clavipes]|nr:hypothetical protein TNCV_2310341 [Trichonephila clavipes]
MLRTRFLCLSLALALSTMHVKYDSSPILKENNPESGKRPPTSLPTNLKRGLVAQRLFRVPQCREGTIHLQTFIPSPGFELRPCGTAVSVTNHYTRWATS